MRGLARASAGLTAAWAGVLASIALLAAPAAFATLPAAEAGRVVGRLFAWEANLSLGLALLLVFMERRRTGDAAEAGSGSVLSYELLLLLGTVFCTVAGYHAVQPLMEAARAGQGRWSFGALHAISSAFFALKGLLVVALAWRYARA
jgi:hypothetical protein